MCTLKKTIPKPGTVQLLGRVGRKSHSSKCPLNREAYAQSEVMIYGS